MPLVPRLAIRSSAHALTAIALAGTLASAQPAPERSDPLQTSPTPSSIHEQERVRARAMIDKAIGYLRTQQDQASGGWRVSPQGQGPTFPAITALVVQGMLTHATHATDPTPADPALQGSLRFLLASQQEDGGIYRELLPSYNTAISLSALALYPRTPELDKAIARAQDHLKGLQYGEGALEREDVADDATKVTPDHAYYGGVGYGNRGRPDLSNLAFAIQGMRDSGLPEQDPFFDRAIAFIERCQMLERQPSGDPAKPGRVVNDMPYAKGSAQGGFIYATSINKDAIGAGQSFAGEIAESLSGPPGSVVRITLSKPADAPPDATTPTKSRDDMTALIRKMLDDAEHAGVEFQVLLGQTGDGASAATFEVRASCDAFTLEQALQAGFTGKHALAGINVDTAYENVPAWRGESRLRAYGSMTYAGFKSYLYAGLTRDDPRVFAAREWIARNYTLVENPGLGTDGLYYYYLMFARALSASGEPTVAPIAFASPTSTTPTPTTSPRVWSIDLIGRLAQLQNDDGSFRGVDDRWMENDPVLITAYALIALRHAAHSLDAIQPSTIAPSR
jgi:hypothetical protein